MSLDAGSAPIWLKELFQDQETEPLWQRAKAHIATSPYALDDWRESFVKLSQWLRTENKKAAAKDCFEYLLCCELAANRSAVDLPLASFVEDFLKSEGFEASQPIRPLTRHHQ